jgi:hypothetical protein
LELLPAGELDTLLPDFFGFVLLTAGTIRGIESGTDEIGLATNPLGAEFTIRVAVVEPKTGLTGAELGA